MIPCLFYQANARYLSDAITMQDTSFRQECLKFRCHDFSVWQTGLQNKNLFQQLIWQYIKAIEFWQSWQNDLF